MNGYDLSRKWFDFCFENPEKICPNHTAMYFFIIEHCNRLGWKEKFGLPTTMVKDAIGIRNFRTYKNTLNDLVEFGFIKMIEVSKNQYSSNIIAIVNYTKASTKALDKALQKHSQKQSKSIATIDKQETINNKPTLEEFTAYVLENDKRCLPKSIELKYKAWVENEWKDGNNKPILNWKTKALNIIQYLEKVQPTKETGKLDLTGKW